MQPAIVRRDSEPASDGAEPPPRVAPSRAEVRSSFEAFFQGESTDATWSRGATETLTRRIQAVLPPGSRAQRLECRGTMCRVEASHADIDEFRSYAVAAFQNRDTRVTTSAMYATVLGEPEPGKPVVSVAFLAREGHALPEVQAQSGR